MQSLIVDGFAGGGGASTGILLATGRHPDIAINHCPAAIEMHKANHPESLHYLNSIWAVDPLEATGGQEVSLAWFSPDCTHFSNARGGVPVKKEIRDLIWVVTKWIREVRPEVVVVENVVELLTYGELMEIRDAKGAPVLGKDGKSLMTPDPARRGKLFETWCHSVRQEGYSLDWKPLCAADQGVPTTRKRLFLVARRDGAPIVWPEPTHSRSGLDGLRKWVPAASIVDWSIPCGSIFDRKKPLVEKSAVRIAKGLHKFVTGPQAEPFLVPAQGSPGDHSVEIAAWLQQRYGGETGRPMDLPFPTVTASGTQQALTYAVLKRPPCDGSLVAAFIAEYYSNGSQWSSLEQPLPTIVTGDRFQLITVTIRGVDFVVTDICQRMLTPRELACAQGFPRDYILTGTKSEQRCRLGNSVCPGLAAAVITSQLKPRDPRQQAA